jgi:nitrate reductase NapE component
VKQLLLSRTASTQMMNTNPKKLEFELIAFVFMAFSIFGI